MKVEIIDQNVFKDISPTTLLRHLAVNGWNEIRKVDGELFILGKSDSLGHRQLVWVPVSEQFSDYEPMVYKVIRTVAQTDSKSEIQVLDDLQTIGIGDVVRLKTTDPLNKDDHTIELTNGIDLLTRARMIARAAASSAVIRRPVHPRTPAIEAKRFVRSLRLGQTERGSFLVKLISPLYDINPLYQEKENMLEGMTGRLPFSRKALIEMVNSLSALKQAAEDSSKKGRFLFTSFLETVPDGVSANLCESLVPLDEKKRIDVPIEISVTWSYIIGGQGKLPTNRISFEPNLYPYIQQAAKEFRARNPEVVTLTGTVNILERDSHSNPGLIRIETIIDGRQHMVRVQLDPEPYNTAIDAHKNRQQVSVTGNLVVEKKLYKLEKPSNFRLVLQSSLFNE